MTVITQTDPVVSARANSIRDQFQGLTSLMRGIPNLHVNEEYSDELQAKIGGYSERRGTLIEQFSKMVDPILAMIEELGHPSKENPNVGDMFAEIDVVRANRMVYVESAANLAEEGKSLAGLSAEELTPIVEQLDEKHKSIHASVKEDLERIGQGIGATIAGRLGSNGDAAEHQLNALAKLNVRSAKAFALAHDARNRHDSVRNTAHACQRSHDAIRRELSRLAASEIRI